MLVNDTCLQKSMVRTQKLDEARNNTASNDLFDGRVLLAREQLSELSSCSKLRLDILRVHILHQFRQNIHELFMSGKVTLVRCFNR